jgi:hypothetical protein
MNDNKIEKIINLYKERINDEIDMMIEAEKVTMVADPYQRAQDSLTRLFVLLVTGKKL